jgi:hypothetical protein
MVLPLLPEGRNILALGWLFEPAKMNPLIVLFA